MIFKHLGGLTALFSLCLLAACGGEPEPTPEPTPEEPEPLPAIEPRLSVIQAKVFGPGCTASQCHAAGQAPEALELAEGRSYQELVNQLSNNVAARSEGRILVVPGKPEESFLLMKLRPPLDPKYGVVMPRGTSQGAKQNEYDAIAEWIRRGALND